MKTQATLLLLADSQLLFQPARLPQLQQHLAGRSVTAAYVGAANGNHPEFYQLACAALETLLGRPVPCAFVRSAAEIPSAPVNLLILAGGSVTAGWEFLRQPAIKLWLDGVLANPDAVVMGVSAGAIHLASGCDPESLRPVYQSYLQALPHFVAVHEEKQGWPSRHCWQAAGSQNEFIAIPLGGGIWYQQGKQTGVGALA